MLRQPLLPPPDQAFALPESSLAITIPTPSQLATAKISATAASSTKATSSTVVSAPNPFALDSSKLPPLPKLKRKTSLPAAGTGVTARVGAGRGSGGEDGGDGGVGGGAVHGGGDGGGVPQGNLAGAEEPTYIKMDLSSPTEISTPPPLPPPPLPAPPLHSTPQRKRKENAKKQSAASTSAAAAAANTANKLTSANPSCHGTTSTATSLRNKRGTFEDAKTSSKVEPTDGGVQLPEALKSLPPVKTFAKEKHSWNSNEEIASILIAFDRHNLWIETDIKQRPVSGTMLLYSRKKGRYRKVRI